jgi:hypothetical protein
MSVTVTVPASKPAFLAPSLVVVAATGGPLPTSIIDLRSVAIAFPPPVVNPKPATPDPNLEGGLIPLPLRGRTRCGAIWLMPVLDRTFVPAEGRGMRSGGCADGGGILLVESDGQAMLDGRGRGTDLRNVADGPVAGVRLTIRRPVTGAKLGAGVGRTREEDAAAAVLTSMELRGRAGGGPEPCAAARLASVETVASSSAWGRWVADCLEVVGS